MILKSWGITCTLVEQDIHSRVTSMDVPSLCIFSTLHILLGQGKCPSIPFLCQVCPFRPKVGVEPDVGFQLLGWVWWLLQSQLLTLVPVDQGEVEDGVVQIVEMEFQGVCNKGFACIL